MPGASQMLECYADTLPPSCRRSYVHTARRFLQFAGGDLGRDRLLAYIRHLEKQRYSPNTIRRFELVAIRGLYRACGIPWPLKRWELPAVSERDIYAPALHPDLISRMVSAATSGKVTPTDAALVAMSTTYGLRRVEMASVTPTDLDTDRGVLYVRTAKRGRERAHLVPDAVLPYLERGLSHPPTPREVSEAYYRVEEAAGLPRMPEVGWHAIRRALTRGLVEANLPEAVIRNFLRWKRSESDMLLRYHAATVVGEDGGYLDPGRQDRQVDQAVFERHPFLPLWGD
ncbi:MAG: phage integrase N-terminal SAM-like domain-containing protein [Bacillota bacterium]|nr:phage integrase N-terminal SAM-like domain-containing protein [Bacillota bacterium]